MRPGVAADAPWRPSGSAPLGPGSCLLPFPLLREPRHRGSPWEALTSWTPAPRGCHLVSGWSGTPDVASAPLCLGSLGTRRGLRGWGAGLSPHTALERCACCLRVLPAFLPSLRTGSRPPVPPSRFPLSSSGGGAPPLLPSLSRRPGRVASASDPSRVIPIDSICCLLPSCPVIY